MKTSSLVLLVACLAWAAPAQSQPPCFNYAADHLRSIGALEAMASARAVAVAGDLAAVGAWDEGLVLADLADPTAPVEIGRIDTPGYVRSTAIAGGLVYAVDAGGLGLMVVDPAAVGGPALVGSLLLGGPGYGLTIVGDRAYVADGSHGLHAVDISDPAAPSLLFTEPTFSARGCAMSGAHLVVADGTAGLKVLDPSAPAGSRVVGQVGPNGQAYGVVVADGIAWVAGWTGGLQAVDVSDPTSPSRLAAVALPAGLALDVAMHQGMVLVAAGPADFMSMTRRCRRRRAWWAPWGCRSGMWRRWPATGTWSVWRTPRWACGWRWAGRRWLRPCTTPCPRRTWSGSPGTATSCTPSSPRNRSRSTCTTWTCRTRVRRWCRAS